MSNTIPQLVDKINQALADFGRTQSAMAALVQSRDRICRRCGGLETWDHAEKTWFCDGCQSA